MANLSQEKRKKMIKFLDELKSKCNDDKSIGSLNEIRNHLLDKKYGLVWEEHSEQVDKMMLENIPVFTEDLERKVVSDNNLPYNFILEGDNLQSLHLLEKTHKGKIDVIYIDPPYNTGNGDFVYNDKIIEKEDSYLHSKWLSFMNKRLKIAKNLLSEVGTIFISIDDNEQANLKLLCDEIFGYKNFEGHIHWRRRSNQPNDKTKLIGLVTEHILVYSNDKEILRNFGVGKVPVTGKFTNPDNDSRGPWATKPWKTGSNQSGTKYEIVTPTGKKYYEEWMGTEDTFNELLSDNRIVFPNNGNGAPRKKYFRYEREEEGQCANNWWSCENFGSNQNATDELKLIFNGECPFDNPKPVSLIEAIINLGCTKKDAIILDFFAGSGTTGHATIRLNSIDKGNRKFILCTNNEIEQQKKYDFFTNKKYVETKPKKNTIAEKKWIDNWINFTNTKEYYKEINSIEYQLLGICQQITYPRVKTVITGIRKDGSIYSDGLPANLKYFKCSWTPRKPDDYLLSNALCLHIKEMIELQNAIEIDQNKNVLILNKDDFKKTILNSEIYDNIEKIWINQNILFKADEMELLNNKGFSYIPKGFFGQELKEVAE